ncbi:MAG: IS4 family transposase [Hormoscilla sp. GUM202]|nr:IS4 family transposase [Hormoscilla sp. GUM202]
MACDRDPSWPRRKATTIKISISDVLTIFGEVFSRTVIKQWVKKSKVRLYWRVLTPLIILWGLIYQRLNSDHTCEAVISHFFTGAVDGLDKEDTNQFPVSYRLKSESTSSYVQGRLRMPLLVIMSAFNQVRETILNWIREADDDDEAYTWKGHGVRLLDGTTFRLQPTPDLRSTYGQASNGKGMSHWVVVKSVIACCLFSQAVIAFVEGGISEPAMVGQIMEQDPEADSIYIGDRAFGVYRVVQVAKFYGKKVLVRLEQRTAHKLLKTSQKGSLYSGQDSQVIWKAEPTTKVEPGLEKYPLTGRIIYVQLRKKGFRPVDLYLFTNLMAPEVYSINELIELSGQRWEVEVDYRYIKTTLEMEEFDVKTAEMFRKELAAGLLTYNLICALMTKAAIKAGIRPNQLSFSCCWRRMRDILLQGVPQWVITGNLLVDWLMTRLAKCRLPHQPNKVKHEPRKVRRRPQVFPALKGSRDPARKQVLQELQSGA